MKKEGKIVKPQEPRSRLTPVDVQQQQFRRSFRGYDEQEVDDFLDRVTQDMGAMVEEIQGLKEQAGRALTTPVGGASDAAEASRAVADITRRAREEADAIIRSAEARAEAIAGGAARPGGPGPEAVSVARDQSHLSRFVGRERGFLQELASLIQSHAESVKQMVQEARRPEAQDGEARSEEARSEEAGSQEAGPVAFPPPPSFGPAHQPSPSGRLVREPFGPAGVSAGRDIEETAEAQTAVAGTAEAEQESETPRRVIEVPDADAPTPVTIGGASRDLDEDDAASRERKGRDRDSSLSELFWGED
jgi:cell division initiation protein